MSEYVTHQSWGSRIKESIKGILVGVVLFLIAFPVLWINEGRAVKTHRMLKQGAGIVVSVSADEVDAANEGALVHISGNTATEETLSDEQFGVSVNAIKLRRAVEMYQWQENIRTETKDDKIGGGQKKIEHVSHSKTWSSGPIDSSKFREPEGHGNPGSIPYKGTTFTAKVVTIGAFSLTPKIVGQLSNFTSVSNLDETNLSAELKAKAQTMLGGYYLGEDPARPVVGDVRIRFSMVAPGEASVVSQQVGSSFKPFTGTGKPLELVSTGIHSAEEMFATAVANNKKLTWILRAVGFGLMFVGLGLVFRPLSVMADVLPILGSIVGTGAGLVAFLIAAVFSLVTIALSWVAYRPMVGIPLLVVAVGLLVAVFVMNKKPKPVAPAEA